MWQRRRSRSLSTVPCERTPRGRNLESKMICAVKRGRANCADVRRRAEETDASQLVHDSCSPTDRHALDEIIGIAHKLLRPEGRWTDSTGTLAALPRSPASVCGDWLSVRQNPNAMLPRCLLAAGAAIHPSCRWCRCSGRRTLDGTNARSGCLRWSTGNVSSTPPFFYVVGAPSM